MSVYALLAYSALCLLLPSALCVLASLVGLS